MRSTKKEDSNALKANVLDINDNQKYRLVAISKNDNPISVNIYGDNNALLHSETITEASEFRKVFDLKNVDSDNIRFEVSNSKRTISLDAK